MDSSVPIQAVTILILVLLSAFFSSAETSMTAANRIRIHSLAEQGNKRAITLEKVISNSNKMLSTILIGNNIVNIAASSLATTFTMKVFGSMYIGVATGVMTLLVLLFGEIIPKVFAQSRPLRFARTVARPILLMRWLMRPFAYILIRTSSTISEHAARRNEISLDELADAVDMTATASAEEHNMLSGIVKFANTEVQEIMRPRVDVVAVGIGDNYLSVKERIIASGFSRIPVCDEDLDNIKGILYVKDLLPYINNGDEFGWQQLLRKAYFVPEHKKINDLLEEFQSNKVHMAVVVDEYGSTLGIVSLEDILEEIVGEISDESDAVESAYTKLDDRNYLFDGKTHIGDFERILQLPENTFADVKGEAETLAGLMLEIKRDFLKKGDVVTTHDLRFTAHTIEGRRIDKVQVTLPE